MDESLAVVLKGPGQLAVETIPIPRIPGPSVRVHMKACGICGSDARYYQGENPWALHTLGKNLPSPPNMVLGHEVCGVIHTSAGERRVAILAYKACGTCIYCLSGRENLCDAMQHFGHSAGWDAMPYYPGGMAHRFDIWQGFAHDIPHTISFDEAAFLDGLAVAVHAVAQGGDVRGLNVGCIGLGPIGLMAAQVARANGAASVVGCDVDELPVRLAHEVGLDGMMHSESSRLGSQVGDGLDVVVDTVGTSQTIQHGLSVLRKSGTLVLLAVHDASFPLRPVTLSGERRIVTSANNLYKEFSEAICLLGSGAVKVKPLVTHRFPLTESPKAFELMLNKAKHGVYKIILHP